jgi:hypothetical protein
MVSEIVNKPLKVRKGLKAMYLLYSKFMI